MKELSFDTGVVTFLINGVCEITFNPTDPRIVSKIYDVFNTLEKKQTEYKERISKMANKAEIFDLSNELDKEMRSCIDNVFGDVSDKLFGEMNVYSAAGGLPVWCNFVLAIIDELDDAFSREQKLTNPRLKVYLNKYKKQ